jgi:hypothetical protein
MRSKKRRENDQEMLAPYEQYKQQALEMREKLISLQVGYQEFLSVINLGLRKIRIDQILPL